MTKARTILSRIDTLFGLREQQESIPQFTKILLSTGRPTGGFNIVQGYRWAFLSRYIFYTLVTSITLPCTFRKEGLRNLT